MKILAFIESADHVCYRYRLAAFAWELAQRGLQLQAVPLEKNVLGRLRQLLAAGWADAVILQRRLLPLWQLRILRQTSQRLIYDIDDAMFCRDSYHAKGQRSASRLARFRATVRAADAVFAGNDYLRHYAAAYADPQRVHAVPTCVQAGWYRPAIHVRRGAAVRLAWIGQQSTLPSLDCLRPHLAAAGEQVPGIKLRLICDASPHIEGVRVVLRHWSSATEADELAKADIGISWLPDDLWSQGKCGLKVLQYMAAGLPIIANPVGVQREMIVQGETGFLANTPSEWAAAIAALAADSGLRARMGAAGRRRAEQRWSVEAWAPRVAELVDRTVRGESAIATRSVSEARSGMKRTATVHGLADASGYEGMSPPAG